MELFCFVFITERRFSCSWFGCANDPFTRGLPCGKRARWSSIKRRLTNSARQRCCCRAPDGVNSNFRKSERNLFSGDSRRFVEMAGSNRMRLSQSPLPIEAVVMRGPPAIFILQPTRLRLQPIKFVGRLGDWWSYQLFSGEDCNVMLSGADRRAAPDTSRPCSTACADRGRVAAATQSRRERLRLSRRREFCRHVVRHTEQEPHQAGR